MSKKFQRKHILFYDSIPHRNMQKIESETLLLLLLRKLKLTSGVKSKGHKTGRNLCLFIGLILFALCIVLLAGVHHSALADSHQASPAKLNVGQCDGLCHSIHIKQMKDNVRIYRPADKTPPRSGVIKPNKDYTLFSLQRLIDVLTGNSVKKKAHYRW